MTAGTFVVLFINWGSTPWVTVDTALMQQMGFHKGAYIRDLWAKKNYKGVQKSSRAHVAGDGNCLLYKFFKSQIQV